MAEMKWCKLINPTTREVILGAGQDPEYYASIGMTYDEVEQSYEGLWYLKGYAPVKPEPTPREIIIAQIDELEAQITDRNVRGAILGDEFALNKLQTIEAQIAELRRQLEDL